MARWEVGEIVAGKYTLEGRLAAGGMGEIYVARMALARGVRRRVVLKCIHAHLAQDPELVSMFVDEARIAGQLSHPGIVPVLDAVEHEGELVVVQEYVPGWDLASVLREAARCEIQMPIEVAVHVASSLATTLAYVHEALDVQGRPLAIVHRDVTPSNVLVAADGSVRLLDFGVAKAAERATRTVTMHLKGKLGYMAPEQARGGGVDWRADLYALGLLLFELLTSRRAITGVSDMERLERARAPHHVRVSSLRDVPPILDELVAQLLEIDPERRPAHGEIERMLEQTRADIGRVHPETARAFVAGVMGSGARSPAGAAPRAPAPTPLERALAYVLRGTGAGSRTKPAAAESASHPAMDSERARPRRSRRAISMALGSVALVAVVGAVAWIVGAREGAISPAARVDRRAPARARAASERGFLRITSTPPGARVRIDGSPWRERTPTIVESDADHDRVVSVTLDDYAPQTLRTRARARTTTDVEVTLVRLAGRLVVRSHPDGAAVSIDGRQRGRAPLTIEDLPRASLRVRLSLEGHAPYETTAPLDAQSEARIDATLARRVAIGTLDVSSTPWARVSIGGRIVAESTPAIGLRLPAGDHTVTLTNPRLALTAQRRVTIREGQRTSLVVRLR